MKKRILSIFLIICVALCAVPYAAFADTGIDLEKRYNLKEGETYYFDLSSLTIPGTKNQFLPDKSLHYVPFTYTGIIDAYELAGTCTTAEETEVKQTGQRKRNHTPGSGLFVWMRSRGPC